MITPEEFLAAGDHLVLFIIIDHQPFYHLDLINLIVKICRWIQTLSLFYTRFTIVPPGSGPQVNKRVNLDFPNSSKNSHWCPIYSGDEASVKEYMPKEKQFLITRSHNLRHSPEIWNLILILKLLEIKFLPSSILNSRKQERAVLQALQADGVQGVPGAASRQRRSRGEFLDCAFIWQLDICSISHFFQGRLGGYSPFCGGRRGACSGGLVVDLFSLYILESRICNCCSPPRLQKEWRRWCWRRSLHWQRRRRVMTKPLTWRWTFRSKSGRLLVWHDW